MRAAVRSMLALAAGLVLHGVAAAAETEPPPDQPPVPGGPTPLKPQEREAAEAEPSAAAAAAGILGFQFLVNRANRYFGESREDFRVTSESIRRNLHSSWTEDRDAYAVNQLGHPYQGATYHGFARSAGFDYWQSLGIDFASSAVWEVAGESTRPSRNDQITTGIGGSFLGEALFRMSSLVLEKGAGLSPFWREWAAAAISPAAGFNRWAYGERFKGVFSSRDAAYHSRLGVGLVANDSRNPAGVGGDFKRHELQLDFSIDYGLPGRRDYDYRRPFDYFAFQATASTANAVENVMTRGLLLGRPYAIGDDFRGVWGLYGSFDYIAPQAWRVSTTALSLGSTGHWWLSETVSLQGTATVGVGYAAVGTRGAAPDADRAYNYGVAPQALLALRLTRDDRLSLDLTAREYFVSDVASGTGGGHDNILRGEASLTWRLAKQQAVTLKLLANRRDARFALPVTSRQTQTSVGLFWTLLGEDRFGVVDWR